MAQISRKTLSLPTPRPPPAAALLLLAAFQRRLLHVRGMKSLGCLGRLLRRLQSPPQARYLIVLHRELLRERGHRLRPPVTGALNVWHAYGIVYGTLDFLGRRLPASLAKFFQFVYRFLFKTVRFFNLHACMAPV